MVYSRSGVACAEWPCDAAYRKRVREGAICEEDVVRRPGGLCRCALRGRDACFARRDAAGGRGGGEGPFLVGDAQGRRPRPALAPGARFHRPEALGRLPPEEGGAPDAGRDLDDAPLQEGDRARPRERAGARPRRRRWAPPHARLPRLRRGCRLPLRHPRAGRLRRLPVARRADRMAFPGGRGRLVHDLPQLG